MNNNKSSNTLSSLLVGAAIGAAAVTMLHEPTRKIVKEKLKKALDEGEARVDEIKDRAGDIKKDLTKKAVRELNKTQKKLASSV